MNFIIVAKYSFHQLFLIAMVLKTRINLSTQDIIQLDTFIHKLEEKSFGKFTKLGDNSILKLTQARPPLNEMNYNNTENIDVSDSMQFYRYKRFLAGNFQILSIKGDAKLKQESIKFNLNQESINLNMGKMIKTFNNDYKLILPGGGIYKIKENGAKRYFTITTK